MSSTTTSPTGSGRRRRAFANAHAVAHLSKLWANFRAPRAGDTNFKVTDTIEKLGGRRPKTFAEFVAEERSSFGVSA